MLQSTKSCMTTACMLVYRMSRVSNLPEDRTLRVTAAAAAVTLVVTVREGGSIIEAIQGAASDTAAATSAGAPAGPL